VGSTTAMSISHDPQCGHGQRTDRPAPKTMTLSPARRPTRNAVQGTDRGSANAACEGEALGSRNTPLDRQRMYSAKAPSACSRSCCCGSRTARACLPATAAGATARSRAADNKFPDRPVRDVVTDAAIVPLHSCSGHGSRVKPQPSRSWWMSEPQIPHEWTRHDQLVRPGAGPSALPP